MNLKIKAIYSITELALMGNVGKRKLTNLLMAMDVNLIQYGNRKFICLTEIEARIPQLFESIRAASMLNDDDEY